MHQISSHIRTTKTKQLELLKYYVFNENNTRSNFLLHLFFFLLKLKLTWTSVHPSTTVTYFNRSCFLIVLSKKKINVVSSPNTATATLSPAEELLTGTSPWTDPPQRSSFTAFNQKSMKMRQMTVVRQSQPESTDENPTPKGDSTTKKPGRNSAR